MLCTEHHAIPGACLPWRRTGCFSFKNFLFREENSLFLICKASKHFLLPEITLILRRAPGHAEKTKGGRFMGKKKHHGKAVDKILQESQEKTPTDVLGSWTGVPWNPEEAPVQDADDL